MNSTMIIKKRKELMTEHILLAIFSGLLSLKSKETNNEISAYLWLVNCILWLGRVIVDIIDIVR